MPRRLAPLTVDSLAALPGPVRSCVHWELDPASAAQAARAGTALEAKQAWVSDTLLQWGSCGLVLYLDDEVCGHVMYAPPAYVARSNAFATSPPGEDAVVLMSLNVEPEHRGRGLGRVLVQAVAADAARRGIRAVETFGSRADESIGHLSGIHEHQCLLSGDFFLAVGFRTVRAHPHTPRLRLDLRSTITWREDVGSALDRIRRRIQPGVPAV